MTNFNRSDIILTQPNICSINRQIYQKKRGIITKIDENLFDNEKVARCRECGEALYDGDTAYLLGGKYYCVSCVDDSMTVCRKEDDGYVEDDYDSEEGDTDE